MTNTENSGAGRIWCISVWALEGGAFEYVAVHADSLAAAFRKVGAAGRRRTMATPYEIDTYGVRFCHGEIK